MVNVRTLRGLHAALLECVPGRAQRGRLLEALARVPGNRHVSMVTAWLKAREDEAAQARGERRVPAPPKSGVFRTKVINYTQSSPDVQVTMTKETARNLLAALDEVAPCVVPHEQPAHLALATALRSALEGKHAAP